VFRKLAHGICQIATYVFELHEAPGFAASLSCKVQVAEVTSRLMPCLVRRQASGEMLLNLELEVQLHLFLKIPRTSAASQP
jgi:hypothetical protein